MLYPSFCSAIFRSVGSIVFTENLFQFWQQTVLRHNNSCDSRTARPTQSSVLHSF